jgi:serine/threonine-protein kinase
MRRVVPYLIIAVAGFSLAYVLMYIVLERTSPAHVQPEETSQQADNTTATPPDAATVPADTTPLPPPEPIQPATTDVPSVIGMSLDDARAVLADRALAVVVQHDTNSFQPPNTILRQTPEAGQILPVNSVVTLTASMFPPEPPPNTPTRP